MTGGPVGTLGRIASVTTTLAWWRRLGAVGLVVAGACEATTDTAPSTLPPLPVPSVVATVPASGATPAATSGRRTPTTARTATSSTSTTLGAPPIGDWDGARFDAGRVLGADQRADGYRTIELDRFSYRDPTIGLVDAAGFTAEPVATWWREDPFVNNQPVTRQFVLAPDAELLALSVDGEDIACADPPPGAQPVPGWEEIPFAVLRSPAARESVAIITYAPTGTITRLRLTHGCP